LVSSRHGFLATTNAGRAGTSSRSGSLAALGAAALWGIAYSAARRRSAKLATLTYTQRKKPLVIFAMSLISENPSVIASFSADVYLVV
jgi:drug/metabolite transporter (DMT)-like permease